MATHITQSEINGVTFLRVSGEMLLDDALLLERIAAEIDTDDGREVVVDLADLDYLDSDSAAVLRRMAAKDGFKIEGMEIFLQSVINEVEKR